MKQKENIKERSLEIYRLARENWEQLSSFRKKRNRCRDYTFGRQWNDIIEVDGRQITEYEYILSEGNIPLKNNLIRRIVRNVMGVFRSRLDDIMKENYRGDLEKTAAENDLPELYMRTLEEFLISGAAIHRKRLIDNEGVSSVSTEIVSPGSFFFNTDSCDIRGRDINLVGQMHRVDFSDWCRAFVTTREDYRKASDLFASGSRKVNIMEVWRREPTSTYLVHNRKEGFVTRVSEAEASSPAYRDKPKKWELRDMWRYYFMTEDGTVVCSGDSPYIDGCHPYLMKFYPFLDGEIHSYVGDMIDQQRYTNRLITLYDWVIRASAKGVLLLPEGAVEPGNIRNVADQWGRFNGVILYKSKPENPEPKQISGNMSNLGISELLEIQLKMMEDVSGVNGILQGNTTGGNVSGELYNSQTTNAMYSLTDIMETYKSFMTACCEKDKALLRQIGMRASI